MERKTIIWIIVGVVFFVIILFGLIFTRSVFCGPSIVPQIDQPLSEEEINKLFGENRDGVTCVGEDGEPPTIVADGNLQMMGCYIKTVNVSEYNFTINKIESLKGASTGEVKSWFITKEGDTRTIRLSDHQGFVSIIKLNPPKNILPTAIKVELYVANNNGEVIGHEILFNLKKQEFSLKNIIC